MDKNNLNIIDALKNGHNESAIKELYKSYPSISKFILRNGGDEFDARDIFQDALLILYRNAQKKDFQLFSLSFFLTSIKTPVYQSSQSSSFALTRSPTTSSSSPGSRNFSGLSILNSSPSSSSSSSKRTLNVYKFWSIIKFVSLGGSS